MEGHGRRAAAGRFAVVAVTGFAMNAAFVAALERLPGADPRLAALFILTVTPVASYLLFNLWAFAPGDSSAGAPPPGRGTRSGTAAAARPRWPVLTLAVLAAVPLLASSLTFGVPQGLDPDELIFVGSALHMLSEQSFDPGWYGAPAQGLIYCLAAVYALYVLVMEFLGTVSVTEAASLYYEDRSAYLVLGRGIALLSATGCLAITVAILREARVGLAATLMAIALFTASPLVLSFSSIVRMDFQQIGFNLLTSYFCLLAITRGASTRNLLLAGACVGGALTSKYTGVAGAATVVATAIWLVARGRLGMARGLLLLVGSALASLAAGFVTGPYLFLSFSEVLADVAREARPSQVGATSEGLLFSLRYYLTEAAPEALGWAAIVAVAAGALVALRHPLGLVTLPFVVSYLLFVSSLNLYWDRWFLPVVPYAAIFLALAADWSLSVARDRHPGLRAVVIGLGALLLAPTAVRGTGLAWSRFNDLDTRVAALDWVEATIPAGARVLAETEAPGLSSRVYSVFIVTPEGALAPWRAFERDHIRVTGYYSYFGQWEGTPGALVEAIRNEGIDLILMGSWPDLFQEEAERYPHEVAVYEALRGAFPLVREFSPEGPNGGPRVGVYRTGKTALFSSATASSESR